MGEGLAPMAVGQLHLPTLPARAQACRLLQVNAGNHSSPLSILTA